ncbi:MAG: permease prefix domain 1-containing protein [Acidimicrobiales bacterium]
MADDGLITAYLRELEFSVARLPDAADIVAEAEDHLLEATERLVRDGHRPADAAAEAVARFGSAALVARVCAAESKRGAAVPTSRTRVAGLAAMLTPVLLVVGQYLNINVPSDRGSVHGIGVMMLVVAIPAFVFGLWGLRARHGGLGRLGKVGIIAACIAPLWFFAAWAGLFVGIALLCFAVVALVVAMLHANVLPVVPLVLVGVGPVGTIALVAAVTAAGGDAGWGNASAFVYLPALLMVVGYVWLGWHLWREPAIDRPHHPDTLATA